MAPRGRPPKFVLPERTLVVDNGAYAIKAGFASESPNVDTDCIEIPNCIARGSNRTWIGPQLSGCTDFAEMVFRRPVQKGYLVNWEAEREIWDVAFFDQNAKLHCDPRETNLVLTEASNGPTQLQTNCDQMIFEEFEFAAYRRFAGPTLNAYNDVAGLFGDAGTGAEVAAAECVLVIDSGYSHTTVTPTWRGRALQAGVRRVEVGGKVLTNALKEAVSVRQVNVQDETHTVGQMKEDACFVSGDFAADLARTRADPAGGGLAVGYVLPDYTRRRRGELRPFDASARRQMSRQNFVQDAATGAQEAVLTLGSERFAVPELLFNPSDAGLQQAGVADAAMAALTAGVPTALWPAMLANVLLVGGSVQLPGFADRMRAELRALAPADCRVRVAAPPDPVKATWLGGARLASRRDLLREKLVTRQEYLERGGAWAAQAFAGDKDQ